MEAPARYGCFDAYPKVALTLEVQEGFRQRIEGLGEFPVYYAVETEPRVLAQKECIGWASFLSNRSLWPAIQATGCPTINYSNRYGALDWAFNVFSDDAEIGGLAARKLAAKGYRRFVYIGFAGHGYSMDRMRGFCDALQQMGHAAMCVAFDEEGAENPVKFSQRQLDQVRSWLEQLSGATAVFAANDLIAISFLRHVATLDADWLPRMAVVGVDNSRESRHGQTKLTTIAPNFHGMGAAIAEAMAALARGEPLHKGGVRRVGGAMWIEGDTTAGPASDDPMIAPVLRKITLMIAAGEPPRVESLAAEFNINRRTLLNHFRTVTGMSLRDYCSAERLRRAHHLLLESNATIAEIAQACGYSKQGDLTAQFRKAYGVAPRALRKTRTV